MANLRGIDKNPLQRRPPQEVIKYARNFYNDNNLHDIVTESEFVKGALYIRDPVRSMIFAKDTGKFTPPNFDDASLDLTLTDCDKRAIEQYEQEDRWKKWKSLSKAHVLLLVACSMGALAQGWDMSAMNAANVFWPFSLHIIDDNDHYFFVGQESKAWILGLVNAAPFISGAFFALFCACPMAVFGRRTNLFVAGLASFIASLASVSASTWKQLLGFRLLLGLGTAFESVIVPIFLAEISPRQIRGMMVTSWQVFLSAGLFLGFVFDLAVSNVRFSELASINWRIMLGLSAIPALLQLCVLPFCVESPRWLIKTGNIAKALQTLHKLHDLDSQIIACGELLLIYTHLINEIRWIGDTERLQKAQKQSSKGAKKNPQESNGEYFGSTEIQLRDLILPKIEDQAESKESEAAESVNNLTNESATALSSNIEAAGVGHLSAFPVDIKTKVSLSTRARVVFHTRHMRSALFASATVMACQQICGIYTFAFYSTAAYLNKYPFGTANRLDTASDLAVFNLAIVHKRLGASVGFALIYSLFSLLAFLAIDWERREPSNYTQDRWFSQLLPERINRRTLLNVSFPGIAFCLIMAIAASSKPAAQLTFFYFATVAYSIGGGPMAPLVASEVFPLVNRELGMCLAVFWNFVLGAIFILVTPKAMDKIPNGYLGVFVALSVLCWALCFMFVPDTQGCSLEVILAQLDATLWETVLYAWELLRHPKKTLSREIWIINRRQDMAS